MSNKVQEYNHNTNTLVSVEPELWVNPKTGETREFTNVNKTIYGGQHFWKVFLMDFLMALGVIESKQLEVFIYILENTDPYNNQFIGTYDKIEKDLKISRPTIAKVMKTLRETKVQGIPIIRMVVKGLYVINPHMMMKGSVGKQHLLISYAMSDDPMDTISKAKTTKNRAEKRRIKSGQTTLTDDVIHECHKCGQVVEIIRINENGIEENIIEQPVNYTKTIENQYICYDCQEK